MLKDLAATLGEKSTSAPWLAEKEEAVLNTWREAYAPESDIDLEEMRSNIRRAKREFEECFSAYEEAEAEFEAARDELKSLMDAIEVDLELHESRSAEYSLAIQAISTARKAVLDALNPDEAPQLNDVPGPASIPPEPRAPASKDRTKDDSAPAESSEKVTDKHEDAGPSSPLQMDGGDDSNEAPEPTTSQPPTDKTGSPTDSFAPAPEEDKEAPEEPHSVEVATWNAIGNGQLGLAYHLARLGHVIETCAGLPSPELLAAVALGVVVRGPSDELADEFRKRIGHLLAGVDTGKLEEDHADALNLLLFCATSRPALFASPQAIPLLRRVVLSRKLTPVYRLANALADHAGELQSVTLDIPTLIAILDEDDWTEQMASHERKVNNWRSIAGGATFLFQPATAVWNQWLAADGILSQLAGLVSITDIANEARVRELIEILSERKSVEGLAEKTRHQIRGRRGQSITGRALSQLEGRLAEPIQLANDWLQIINTKPGSGGFLEKGVKRLRDDMKSRLPPARNAIQKLGSDQPDIALKSALRCTQKVIESLEAILLRDGPIDEEIAINPVRALSDDLLLVPGLIVDEQGGIEAPTDPADALALLTDPDAHAKTLAAAFEIRLTNRDLYGANAICTGMADEGDPSEDDCRGRLQKAVADSGRTSLRKLDELTKKLEQAFIVGEVSDNERADTTDQIREMRRQLARPDQILMATRSVSMIENEVTPRFNRGIQKVKAELNEHLPRDDAREQESVERALAEGDLTTLLEQRDCVKTGQPLLSPEAGQRLRFLEFLEVAKLLSDKLAGEAGPTPKKIFQAVEQREDMFGIKFSSLSITQAQRAAGLLNTWYLMTRADKADPDLVSHFFTDLGFTLAEKAIRMRTDTSLSMQTEPLRARELCPAHSFGSAAGGRYEIVMNRGVSASESIVQAIDANPNSRTFVLYFGKLTLSDREWLRRWSIIQSAQFVTIDETLVLYLASLPDGTLRALFDCTLPFTCVEPFFTAPGLVPPESFFGRESERRTILERYGSCFVYGGRQLGKTALLHAAEAAFHNPEGRQIAQYLDLKVHDIGVAVDADNIWQLLWTTFGRVGVVPADRAMPQGRDSLVEALADSIGNWVNKDDDSRILLLLDEADAFLTADLRNDFRVSTRLKGLMDQTKRKFKVVLCGLHNVLRNTERANHPLAHFGEPVCVGPLLSNGDLEQARALIRDPLAAVGYTFENANLLTQILVWTNYYPSLIQLYGEALLRYLRHASGRKFPRPISSDDIQAVSDRDQFRDYIRDRFLLTLQLDPRYEVIAYAMAADLLDGSSDRFSKNLQSSRILELAREAWPQGFNLSQREFDTLLQEMSGLGVLRQRPSDIGISSYVFRNPNVLLLLGNTEEVWEVLCRDRVMPNVFEASEFHGQVGGSPQSAQRTPLTYEQEALLKRGGRVTVLCGTPAGNIRAVEDFLTQRMEGGRVRELDSCVDDTKLRKQLTALRPSQDSYNICLVHHEDPWTVRWLERALSVLKEIRRGAFLRVVFVADAEQLWRFVAELPDEYIGESNSLFDWVGVKPWSVAFLRRWCSDQNLHEATDKAKELFEITGGWPSLLEHYADSSVLTWKYKKQALEEHIERNRDELLKSLGLGSEAARREIITLRGYGILTPHEVDEIAESLDEEGNDTPPSSVLRRRLCWASQLGLVQTGGGTPSLNPLVTRLLSDKDS